MKTLTAGVLAVVIFLAGALAGTAVSAQRRPTDPQCGSATAQVRTTLYFGLSKQKGSVSELEWQMFLRDEVTTRFPAGLTAWEAEGQWRGSDGTIGHERSKMSLKGAQFNKAEAVEQVVRNGVEKLKAIPGVVQASATCCVPLQGGYGLPFRVVGRPLAADAQGPYTGGAGWMTVSPGYFEVFKIPVKRGRTFNERDTSTSTPTVVINEAMAKQFWPKGDPLTDRLLIGKGVMREFEAETDRQIIGIVADIKSNGLDSDAQPQMFVAQAQVPDAANALNVGLTPISWIVRTQTPPQALSSAIQDQLRQATGLPVTDVTSMDDIVSVSVSRQKFNMWVMSVFGGCALLLAAIGIYGLMAYSVEQRTQEIGIRLALGAQGSHVKNMVVRQGMGLALVGIVLGLGGAFWLARFITAFLFGVTAKDPVVFAGVPVLLTAIAFLSVWLPARRASQVDPIIALRAE